ncbi:MAG: hypothetical protein ACFFDN_45340, partial [Candidatus Hodarchaeota archaeon]
RIFIVDYLDNEIKEVDTTGNLKKKWGRLGTASGEFLGVFKILNDYDGNLYVLDVWNSRIQKFDSNGNFKSEWGIFNWIHAKNILDSNIAFEFNKFTTTDILVLDSLRINYYHYEISDYSEVQKDEKTFVREKIIDAGVTFGIPIIHAIVYDPPGKGSYGYIESGRISYTSLEYDDSTMGKIGLKIDIETVGSGLEQDLSTEIIDASGTSFIIKKTSTEQITSSKSTHTEYIGPGRGDVVWGEMLTNYRYYIERTTYDSKGNVLNIETTMRTRNYIGNKFMISMADVPNFFNNSISSILTTDNETKNIAYDNYWDKEEQKYSIHLQDCLFYGDGVSYEYKTGIVDTKSQSITWGMKMSRAVSIKLGFDYTKSVEHKTDFDPYGKVGVMVETEYNFKSECTTIVGGSLESSWRIYDDSTTSNTMGFVFNDETSKEPIDRYQFSCYKDLRHQTLAFINDNYTSYSSEPWEYNTLDRCLPIKSELKLVDENNELLEEPYYIGETAKIRVEAEDEETAIDQVIIYKVDPEGEDTAIASTFDGPADDGYYYINWVPEDSGTFLIYALVFDKGQNNLSSSEVQVIVDHIAPNYVSIIPFETPQLPGIIECRCIAIDNHEIDHVKYYDGDPIVGGEIDETIALNNDGYSDKSENGWLYNWLTTRENDTGPKEIYVLAFDKTGNFTEAGPAYIFIGDEINPSKCEIVAPLDYDAKNDDFTIYVEVHDELSGVSKVEFYDGDPSTTGNLTHTIVRNPFYPPLTECHYNWDTNDLEQGLHGIYVIAYDNYSNNKTDMINYYFDNSTPNPFNISWGYHTNHSIDLWVINFSDDVTEIVKVEYYKGNELIGVSTDQNQFHFYWLGPNGTHQIHARVYDIAGNFINSTNTETVIIDYLGKDRKSLPLFPIISNDRTSYLLIIGIVIGVCSIIAASIILKKKRNERKKKKK